LLPDYKYKNASKELTFEAFLFVTFFL